MSNTSPCCCEQTFTLDDVGLVLLVFSAFFMLLFLAAYYDSK